MALANLPIVGASTAGLDALLEEVRMQTGFCMACATHFHIDGEIDPATVPATSSVDASSAVVMVDADPRSPELIFEPMVDMIEWMFQGIDGRVLAPRAYRDPLIAGPRPDLLIQIAELDDFLPMWAAQAHAAAFGAERIGAFDFAPDVPEATLPVTQNLDTPAGAVTVVAHLYAGAGHVMVGSNTSDVLFEAPIIPPLRMRAEPLLVTNPTTELHLEIRRCFESRLTTGHAIVGE